MKWFKRISVLFSLLCIAFWFGMGYVIKEGQKPKADGTAHYAIVLGAKVHASGLPSKSLKYRLDAAYDYAEKYPDVQLILSGGQGQDEPMTEAEAMRNYLVNKGFDENRLILENQSTSTYENIKFSMTKIPLTEKKITIISNDFHLARAKMIAENLGYENVDVVGAPTPKAVTLKLEARERAGLILQKIQLWR